ncbi:FliG C-terminal domain-containing protein [Consotaella aegiceratis]|uniref:FliG C-terminal domain-containing protein n=1 Tax=Consotaella aegiceratis TaxID=3097961 RepID=UPI002F3F5FC6
MATTYVTQSRMAPAPQGAARAAILLLTLGAPGAAKLLKHLTPDEIRAVRESAVDLEPVSRAQLDELVEEFQEALKTGPGLSGPGQQMKELLKSALSPEELATILDDDAEDDETPAFDPNAASVWSELEKLDKEALVATLKREHPQVVAVILAKLDADIATALVVKFEPVFRHEVMRRMLSVKQLAVPVRMALETQLRLNLLSSQDQGGGGKYTVLAEIANRMEKRQADELLEAIAATQPKDAASLKNLLFAFEDIPNLPLKSRFVLFDGIPTETVIFALAGANEDIKTAVLEALGARARRMVEAELGQNNDMAANDVSAARRTISRTALNLAAEGKLILRMPEESEE